MLSELAKGNGFANPQGIAPSLREAAQRCGRVGNHRDRVSAAFGAVSAARGPLLGWADGPLRRVRRVAVRGELAAHRARRVGPCRNAKGMEAAPNRLDTLRISSPAFRFYLPERLSR